jgi:hypothetical protein
MSIYIYRCSKFDADFEIDSGLQNRPKITKIGGGCGSYECLKLKNNKKSGKIRKIYFLLLIFKIFDKK